MNFIVPNSSAKLECVEFRENNSREHYARLVLGPVAPGQGVTLGKTSHATYHPDRKSVV